MNELFEDHTYLNFKTTIKAKKVFYMICACTFSFLSLGCSSNTKKAEAYFDKMYTTSDVSFPICSDWEISDADETVRFEFDSGSILTYEVLDYSIVNNEKRIDFDEIGNTANFWYILESRPDDYIYQARVGTNFHVWILEGGSKSEHENIMIPLMNKAKIIAPTEPPTDPPTAPPTISTTAPPTEKSTTQPTGPNTTTTTELETTLPKETTSSDATIFFSGSGDKVTETFTYSGLAKFTITHDAYSHFAVKLYDTDGDYVALLANEIEPYSGEKLELLEADKEYIFEVTANGNWTIAIE